MRQEFVVRKKELVVRNKMNYLKLIAVSALTVSIFLSAGIRAEEMDHSKHKMPTMDHSKHKMAGHDMSEHSGHDTGAVAHIHHSHGKGAWMFEYRYMSMKMDGLLQGSDSVSTQSVSGVNADMTNDPNLGMQCAPQNPATGAPRVYLRAAGTKCMAPTSMTMNMHMFMAMYGLSDKVSLMGMINYVKYDMDMVMHMFASPAATMPMMNMTGDMETSGWSDIQLGGMYTMTSKLTLSMNISLPTGAIDEQTRMTMYMQNGNLARSMEVRAPYAMQLGSGTLDFIPSVTLKDVKGNLGYGAQMTVTKRTGHNDEGYKLGDRFELMGWVKYAINNKFLVSVRLNFMDWDSIDGRDSNIMSMMNITNDPLNSGGTRYDLLLSTSGFIDNHMFGIEYGFPIQQDLDGVQMETDSLINVSYQYLM